MSYVALYRKFRPALFSQVVGQDHVVRTLKNQLINKRIGHAYLFTGTRGTGKTSAAKIFAKALNCLDLKDGEPCNECENCRSIDAGNFVDVVEVDAASNNGVDDIRQIIEEIRYTPVRGAYKVFIIDEAHMITGQAFNAFLKTLEEPPAYAVFILATTEPHKLPVTILSRVQRYDFRRISTEHIAGNLQTIVSSEGVKAQEKALRYIARMGDGSMRDSVSLLDKCIAFNLGEELTYERVLETLGTVDAEVFSNLFRSVYNGNVAGALQILDDASAQGRDLSRFASDFIWYIRNILLTGASGASDMEMLGVSAENMLLIREDAAMAQPEALMRYIRILSETIDRMRFSSGKQILLEVALIKLARPQMEADVQSLTDRIRQLEAGMENVKAAAGSTVPGIMHQAPVPGEMYQRAPQFEPAFPEEEEYYRDTAPAMKNPDALAGLIDGGSDADRPVSGQMPSGRMAISRDRDIPGQAAVPAPVPDRKPADHFWQDLLGGCESRMVRTTLNKCSGALSPEDVLDIYAPNDFIRRQLNDSQIMEQLKSLTFRIAGRQIQIRILSEKDIPAVSSPSRSMDDVFPEELLKNINFDIGTEEY